MIFMVFFLRLKETVVQMARVNGVRSVEEG